jgi:hypothetical protein
VTVVTKDARLIVDGTDATHDAHTVLRDIEDAIRAGQARKLKCPPFPLETPAAAPSVRNDAD